MVSASSARWRQCFGSLRNESGKEFLLNHWRPNRSFPAPPPAPRGWYCREGTGGQSKFFIEPIKNFYGCKGMRFLSGCDERDQVAAGAALRRRQCFRRATMTNIFRVDAVIAFAGRLARKSLRMVGEQTPIGWPTAAPDGSLRGHNGDERIARATQLLVPRPGGRDRRAFASCAACVGR